MSGRRFLAASLVSLAVAVPAHAQQIGVAVGDGSTTAVAPGGTISIPVVVDMSAAGGLNLASLSFDLNWDAARLSFVSSAPGSFGTVTINEGQTASGVLTAGVFNPTGTTSSFTALTLTLTAGATEGATPITIQVTAAGDEPGQSIIGSIVTTDLSLCVGVVGSFGDVTGDDAVNIIDAQQIARFSVGLSITDPARMLTHGDVNADGATNIIDAQQVARVSVGLPTSGRTGDPVSGGCTDPPPTNQLPTAAITSPADGSSFDQGSTISFQGTGSDPEDGALSGASLVWTSSLDNAIGTGTSFSKSDLSVGQHTITLTATDSDGGTGTKSVSITINGPSQPPLSGKIVFSRHIGFNSLDEAVWELRSMTDTGSDVRPVTDAFSLGGMFSSSWQSGSMNPAVSRDGHWVAYKDRSNFGGFDLTELKVANVDGNILFEDFDLRMPSFSPDGGSIAARKIISSIEEKVVVLDSDGSGDLREIYSCSFFAVCFNLRLSSQAWSPGGAQVVVSYERSGENKIDAVSVTDGSLINLVNWGTVTAWDAAVAVDLTIAFTSNLDGNNNIFLRSNTTGVITRLTVSPANDSAPVWSGDGTRLAFVSNRDGNDEIYVINRDGTGLTRLTTHPLSDRDPHWVP